MTTLYETIRTILEASPLWNVLERRGFKGVIGEAVRFALIPYERKRHRAIASDYRACEQTIKALRAEVPQGDPSKPVWMIGSMHTVWGVKLEGVMSLAVRLAGMTPVAVHPTRFRWVERYHRAFGVRRALYFEMFQGIARHRKYGNDELSLKDVVSMDDLMNLNYRGVDAGRIAVSNYVYKNKFVKFDIGNPSTRQAVQFELDRVRLNVLAAEAMLSSCRPVMGCILEKGISPFAEIYGACIADNIPVIQYVGSQNTNQYVLKRYSYQNRHQHPFSLDESIWESTQRMPWSQALDDELMGEFAQSYRLGTWFNRRYLHHDKRIKSAADVRRQLGLDASKKTAVVFSHVLWDATFFYGTSLFQDYETWLVETVKAACRNPQLNWIIKLHPDLVWKLKYEKYTGELRDAIAIRSEIGKLPGHVVVVGPETDISTYSFFELTDLCVTVRGTIGIEMACHGIPVLTAGTGRYSGLGFTIDSQSQEEYRARLAQAHSISTLSAEQTNLARRFAYTLFMKRPWTAKSFELVKQPISTVGDPLDTNIVIKWNPGPWWDAEDLSRLAEWLRSDNVDFIRAS